MMPSLFDPDDFGFDPLGQVARGLVRTRPHPSRLSPFVLMTDPDRLGDPVAAARKIPHSACIIYRHFGNVDKVEKSIELRRVTFERRQQFLIAAEPELAVQVGADGVHFRRDASLEGPMLWRRRCPEMILTMAGLKGLQNYTGDLSVLDGLFLSSVFDSDSPSAGTAIGLEAFRRHCRDLPVPVFALGGISRETAPALQDSGAAGFAGVSGLVSLERDF